MLLLAPVLCCFQAIVTATRAPVAVLDSGPVFGVQATLPSGIGPVNKFLGIPYAEKPTRFSPPTPPKRWTRARNATAYGPSCLASGTQLALIPGGAVFATLQPPEQGGEDCLYINVFAPASEGPPGGRPAVILIPGGGFQAGGGSSDLSGFAAYEDIVAVSFNYRTNVFGFPNAPELPISSRNLGLLDQRRAFEWVQANAAALGADPSKVTIWGGSAGSMSVGFHMQAYAHAASPPFRAAILSSGQGVVGPLATLPLDPSNYSAWNSLSTALGCGNGTNSLACLRTVDAATLQRATFTNAAFLPVVDNLAVPGSPFQSWSSGSVTKIPMMSTNVAQEGRALVDTSITLDLFTEAFLDDPFVTASQRNAILAFYRGNPNLKSDFDINAAIYTDMLWICPQSRLGTISATVGVPTWRYYFNASTSALYGPQYSWLGAFHGSDVMLVASSAVNEGSSAPGLSAELYTLGVDLRGALARFVKNPMAGPGWPAVKSQFAPLDLAVLGNVSDVVTGGATAADDAAVNPACYLYDDIYAAIASVTG